MAWRDLLAQIVHALAGLLTGITTVYNPLLSVLMYIIFIIYEMDEDFHIRDKAYEDILFYALGLYTIALLTILPY